MIITKDFLESKGACAEGVKLFSDMFPDGFDLSLWSREKQIEIIKTDMRKFIGWTFLNNILPLWCMSGADLYGADLYGADLYGADLYGADLYGADLYGAFIDRDPAISGYKYENGHLWAI